MLYRTLSIVATFCSLLCAGCDEAVEQSSSQAKPIPVTVVAKPTRPKREKPEVLIDTTLQGLGSVQVAYYPVAQQLWIKSWGRGDTIAGSTDWVFLKDSLPMPVEPVLGICYIHKNKVSYTNIMLGKDGMLFFAIADQMRRAHLYAVQKSGKAYEFICSQDSSCSLCDSTPDCKILDVNRNRLLRVTGIGYDEERDWDIQKIDVYQYNPGAELSIGTLKINNWRDDQCKDEAILTWWKAYLKIANQKHFDQYLAIPKKNNDGKD